MPRKLPADPNRHAFDVAQLATGRASADLRVDGTLKNPAAVILGRMGGKIGGKARAAKMTKEQRVETARAAARARWGLRAKD